MNILESVILAVVEGLTEYLPISSTGHLIITSAFMGINENPFTKDYTVIVQFGAILSVVVLYWRRFLSGAQFYKQLIVGFIPAAVIGLLVKNKIDGILGNVSVVAWALLLGGVFLLWIDRWERQKSENVPARFRTLESLSYTQILLIGTIQCFAFIPGVSRAAATIVGGMFQGLDRKSAAEFSFLLAVPTLAGATCLKLLKILPQLQASHVQILLVGNVVSFVVGVITIRAFIGFLSQGGFKIFGIYRIALGAGILVAMAFGHTLKFF